MATPLDDEFRGLIEQNLRSSFEHKLEKMIERRLKIKLQQIVPIHYFSFALIECRDMYVAGHFYGCITLCQSVAEGLSKFLVAKSQQPLLANGQKTREGKDFEDRVRRLRAADVISAAAERAFLLVHADDRNHFHHLNVQIQTDREKLETRAEECFRALSAVESEVFEAGWNNEGKLVVARPHLWPINGDRLALSYIRPV